MAALCAMPEPSLPKLDDPSDKRGDGTSAATPGRQTKSLLKIALEVLLISIGVFLALMGEQWRENAEHHGLARASPQRFRTEIQANRKALAEVTDYHDTTRKRLEAYFASDGPKTAETFDVQFQGLGPVFFEQTAWDLALATQSLAHIEPDPAFALSRAYTVQRGYTAQQDAIVQSTIYGRSWNQDFEGYWRSVLAYYGDLSFLDPSLLRAYDDVVPMIDRALGDSPAESMSSK
jgi:hypothetical protein